jgi:hypothetical protein
VSRPIASLVRICGAPAAASFVGGGLRRLGRRFGRLIVLARATFGPADEPGLRDPHRAADLGLPVDETGDPRDRAFRDGDFRP